MSKKYHLFIATVRVFIFIDEIIINCEHANYYLDALALMQPLNSLNSIQWATYVDLTTLFIC